MTPANQTIAGFQTADWGARSTIPRLMLDTRLGGAPRYVLATPRELMSLPHEIETCVAFLARMTAAGEKLTGTAFFVNEKVPEAGKQLEYIVTARHVVEKIKTLGRGSHCYVRVNVKGRGLHSLPLDLSHWVFHEDDRVDVAVAVIDIREIYIDHMAIPTDFLATEETVRNWRIGPGTQIYFPGLFYRHAGRSQVLPIIRFGHIAAMPIEPIDTKLGPIEAYLIEARSIGGLSGSPMFVDFGETDHTYLLGLVHGHYGVRDIPDSDEEDTLPFPADKEERSVNMGIGMAIPAQKILDVLQQPAIMAAKRAFIAEQVAIRAAELPTMDGANQNTPESS